MQLYVTVNNYYFNLKWRPLFIEGSISNLSILFVRNLWEINPIFLQISNSGIVLLYYIIMLFNWTISIVLAIKYNIFDCYLLDQNDTFPLTEKFLWLQLLHPYSPSICHLCCRLYIIKFLGVTQTSLYAFHNITYY